MRTQPILNRFPARVKRWLAAGLLFSAIPFELNAQTEVRKNQLGIFTGLGKMGGGLGVNPQLGLVYERKFTNHSSLELGARWMFAHFKSTGFTQTATGKAYHRTQESYDYFSMPVLYKFTSSIVNVSAGPVLNLMTGKFETNESWSTIRSFEKPFNTLNVGAMFKVGKAIHFKNRFVLEPEVGVSKSGYFKKPVWETNVILKYKL
ncbi:hypothetical protein U0035_19880 [Niabella yanshanensis]|uniref:Outer membrane protein beta-barrel domain-containing protein n=1 Tax=Niabella yanshanensis TaxID=577386 RepID=A0ABZ0W7D6_9BACT|nr:hypothetical protein [Niabella yanshanensis]WQD37930.1 hypothetical protein U0035_19880 [Niabella yanshanensis]